jgi:RNA polymerase sigma factor (sigma-70 family)
MHIAGQIAARLKRRFTWLLADDLYSYALTGLVMAAKAFDAQRGVPFPNFASLLGMYMAIDEMRRDRVIQRPQRVNRGRCCSLSAMGWEEPDAAQIPDRAAQGAINRIEARDMVAHLLAALPPRDRQIMLMRYADNLTFGEIGAVVNRTESCICLRHKAILVRLRRLAHLPSTS